jgi:F-type H+-transporting ATPase subunit epsilon
MAEALPKQMQLEIATPDRQVARETVDAVTIPGKNGYLGVLPGHSPLLSELRPGELSYKHGTVTHSLAVSRGFAEVLPDRVIILAETAERPEEIDAERAEDSRRRAEERLASSDPETDLDRARASLERAQARLQVARRAVEAREA